MVLETRQCELSNVDLPRLCLKSMTQVQLEKLVPKLVTKVTGRTSPLFGTVSQKPDWWPKSIDWINPDQLCLKYEDPCETLREIVRSCYQHSEKENLLYADDSSTRYMPSTPSPVGTKMCVVDNQDPSRAADSCPIDAKMTDEGSKTVKKSHETKNSGTNSCDSSTKENSGHNLSKGSQERRANDKQKSSDRTSEPIEIIIEDLKSPEKPSQKTPEKVKPTSSLGIGAISPSIISEIDKHIMASLGSFNFGNVKPKRRKRSKSNDSKEVPNGKQPKGSKDGSIINGPLNLDIGLMDLKGSKLPSLYDLQRMNKPFKRAEGRGKPVEPKAKAQPVKTEQELKTEPASTAQEDDDVVWACFICAKGFSNQSDLMSHQDVCEDDADTKTDGTTTTNHQTSTKSSTNTNEKVHVGTKPKPGLEKSPVPALLRKVGSDLKSLPLGLPMTSRLHSNRKRKRKPEIYIPPPRDTYFESLGLVPTRKVDQIKTPHKTQDDDCQIIDLTLEEDKSPQSQPMTPRTHLMMTQVSRDGTRRRHLSFSQLTPPKVTQKQDFKELSSSSLEESMVRPCRSVIRDIPLSSPLGQRLKKHWQGDSKIPIITKIETFCQTSNVQYYSQASLEEERKGKFTEKLRNRPPPAVTFKFTKKYINKWFHKYKFNKEDKLEFERTFATGLEKRSRILLSKMKKCKVGLERLSKKDIKYWTTRRPRPQPSFSNLQLMRQHYNNQLRMSQYGPRHARPGVQYLQSAAFPRHMSPVQQQFVQVVSGPIPQFLVRNGLSANTLKLLPVNQQYAHSPAAPRPKQTFQKKCVQDNTVICLSSDEEEEESQESSQKLCSRVQQVKKPRIGPASFMRHQQALQQRAQVLRKSVNPNQNVSPVSMVVNTGKADSVSSRVFGKGFTKLDQSSISHKTNPANENLVLIDNQDNNTNAHTSLGSDYSHVRLTNGRIVDMDHQTENQSGSGTQSNIQIKEEGNHSSAGAQQDEAGSPAAPARNGSVSDSEYMDFEVICIDSDEDD